MSRRAILIGAFALGACRPAEGPAPATGPQSPEDARKLVLELVNRDREQAGLGPVEWDEAAAKAAQNHVDDMTRSGYTGHWGTDGSVPEERYTRAGGEDFVQENAACFFDGQTRELDSGATFDAASVAKIEAAFMAEVPPHDGHRRNILAPHHNRLGVALARPVGIPQPCMAQEFVDDYGSFDPLPAEAKVGATITVSGELSDPVEFGAIGIARIEPAAPIAVTELLGRSTYTIPTPYIQFAPPGFVTPKPVKLEGRRFRIDVTLDDRRRPGRYEISVWGKHPGSADLVMVSLRTLVIR